MNVSFVYQKTHYILSGLILALLSGFTITWLTISFYSDLYLDPIESRILNDILCIITPILFGLGVYLIIKTTFHYELQFSETNFKYYRNSKLKVDVPVEEISGIFITHKVRYDGYGGEYEYKIIEIEINEKREVRLTIGGKNRISRFLIFAESLKQFCRKKKITFQDPKVSWRKYWGIGLQDKFDSRNFANFLGDGFSWDEYNKLRKFRYEPK